MLSFNFSRKDFFSPSRSVSFTCHHLQHPAERTLAAEPARLSLDTRSSVTKQLPKHGSHGGRLPREAVQLSPQRASNTRRAAGLGRTPPSVVLMSARLVQAADHTSPLEEHSVKEPLVSQIKKQEFVKGMESTALKQVMLTFTSASTAASCRVPSYTASSLPPFRLHGDHPSLSQLA